MRGRSTAATAFLALMACLLPMGASSSPPAGSSAGKGCVVKAGLPKSVAASASGKGKGAKWRGGRRASIRVRCLTPESHPVVSGVTLTPNKKTKRVSGPPVLTGGGPADSVNCGLTVNATGSDAIRCNGRLSSGASMRIGLRLRSPVCKRPRLRVGLFATLSRDCKPGQPCPADLVVTRAQSAGALGCS